MNNRASSYYYNSIIGLKSFPEVLFSNGGAAIMKNSIVFLYCVINSFSPTLTMTWTKDGFPLVPNIPHVRIRKYLSHNQEMTLLLVVDTFQEYDHGSYQCIAEDWRYMISGVSFNLTGS